MALANLLSIGSMFNDKRGISEERLNAIKPVLRKYIAYWREYPDMFVDFLATGYKEDAVTTFKFYFY